MPTFDEFMATVLEVFPEAIVEEQTDGELVVYTRMMRAGIEGKVVPMPEDE